MEEMTPLTKRQKLEKFKELGKITEKNDGKIITDESKEIIHVQMKTYYKVLMAAGGWGWFCFLMLAMFGLVYTKIQLDYTIGKWVSLKEEEAQEKF